MIAVGAVEPPDVARMPVPAISSFASAEDFLIDSRSLAMCWRFLLQVPAFAFCHLMLITSTQAIFTLPVGADFLFPAFYTTPHLLSPCYTQCLCWSFGAGRGTSAADGGLKNGHGPLPEQLQPGSVWLSHQSGLPSGAYHLLPC